MGDEETVTAVAEAVANGTTTPEQEGEDIPQKKEEEKNGVKEMEEDGKGKADEKVGSHNMDVDPEDKENKETKDEEKIEEKESKEEKEEKKEETISEAMEEEAEVDENVDELKGQEEMVEESTQEKGSKRRGKGKTAVVKAKSNKKEMEEEQKTPVAPTIERPVRERKSVERLVTSIEKESVKEFHIEKGRGTALKDIPNVAYKLSKRKADDTLKLLHTIIFGRRGKAVQVKSNISRFSGFVWKENEEKQKIKVKEKFDKCVKEKLIEFCDVLDITIAKANTRKEDIVAKLIDFLVAPHSTTSELLAEKEQSSKGKKRKRVVKESASMFGSTPAKRSAKTSRKIEDASKERGKNNTPVTEDESDEEEEEEEEHEEEENMNGVPESSKREVPEHSESEENKDEFEDESEEDTSKNKHGSKKLSAKKESAGKAKTKKVATPKKSNPPPTKRTPVKSSSKRSKVDDSSDTSPKTFSRKKKTEVVKEKPSTPKKPASMEKTGKKVVKGKDKPKEDKLRPSDDELRNAICEILKEVDFNTATFTDILKLLAGRFNTDLTSRKSSIKLMIQDELTKLADEVDDEEEEGNAEKDETQPSGQGVEA